jgi:hypothetical protein
VECARAAAERDNRIQVRVHPKGERIGEAYRHAALQEARGTFVCQIADDDLWLPNHLEEMALLLEKVEFGNVTQVEIALDGTPRLLVGDLARPEIREALSTTPWNFFGPTAAGYRMSAYRRLPVGWEPAPKEFKWSDLFMWRKFLALPDVVCGTRLAITNLHFSNYLRGNVPLEKRAEEMSAWTARITDAKARDGIVQQLLHELMWTETLKRHQARFQKKPVADVKA